MIHFYFSWLTVSISIPKRITQKIFGVFERNAVFLLAIFLSTVSVSMFVYYYMNGLGLSYNDARSHLDIGRRVVEGLKPGLAQLGSVWLPLPHILMVPTIWNDFMWHTGLAGGVISMISFIITGLIIYAFLHTLGVSMLGRIVGVFVFVINLNVLYLQSIAMTELLLLVTMTAGVYELLLWHKNDSILHLIKASFWVMLSTLVRYDGWFLFVTCCGLVCLQAFRKRGFRAAEGIFILFCTMAGLGIVLWFLWNWAIFKDPLYFAFGPFSAHAQQQQLEDAGVLVTKGHWFYSLKVYLYALLYNSNTYVSLLGLFGAIYLWFDKKISLDVRIASTTLMVPFVFNIIALYLGHSVLFIQGLSGNTWFNARYGILMMPSLAIFIGYLIHRLRNIRWLLIGSLAFVLFFSLTSADAVTIDDARVGSSQKNVTEVSSWLSAHAKNQKGFILISAASHDAIIFSSGLPMSRFIHEGTGAYWDSATTTPDRWARWIILRTNDTNDFTYRLIGKNPGFMHYDLIESYPFADIYQIKPEYLPQLITDPVLKNLK